VFADSLVYCHDKESYYPSL